MGIDKFNTDAEDGGGSSKEFTPITMEEMVSFLSDLPYDFVQCSGEGGHEAVFETNRAMQDNRQITLRVFSSIDERSGKSRKKGADAIRTVLWHRGAGRPIGGRTRTHRIKTWRKNLRKKIKSLIEETDEYVHNCSECGAWMVERDGKYGKFLGCINYPDCENTEQIDDD